MSEKYHFVIDQQNVGMLKKMVDDVGTDLFSLIDVTITPQGENPPVLEFDEMLWDPTKNRATVARSVKYEAELLDKKEFITEQINPEWDWLVLAAYYGNDGNLHIADSKYIVWPIKSALALLREEGWELVRVVPIKVETTGEVKRAEVKMKTDFWSRWIKKLRNLTDMTEMDGEAFYYFKKPKGLSNDPRNEDSEEGKPLVEGVLKSKSRGK